MRTPLVVVLGLTVGLTACSAPPDGAEAADAARRFVSAAASRPDAACALLAPDTVAELERSAEKPCAEALPEEELPSRTSVAGVEVAGHAAQVRLDGQVVFLSLFDAGWRVVAAGCTREEPDPSRPYTCLVEGG